MDPRFWRIEPMLATTGEPPSDQRGWGTEYKWDGQRARALVQADARVEVLSRNNNPISASFPELNVLGELADGRECVLDGEIVCLRGGRPDFAQLQRRMHLRNPSQRLLRAAPASYMVFDLLWLDTDDLTAMPYRTRRDLLASLGFSAGAPTVQVPPHYEDLAIEELLVIAEQHGLEGVIAKRLNAPYRPGRSPSWVKIPFTHTTEALIGGWQPGRGSLTGTAGALLIGAYTPDRQHLAYLGRVSSGLTHAQRRVLADGLPELEITECPFIPAPPVEQARGVRWVQPLMVVDVAYRELTKEGRLRAPVWRGVRGDRDVAEITLPTR